MSACLFIAQYGGEELRRLASPRGLSVQELQDIRKLEAICGRNEPLNMKLNWDMLEVRSKDETNDFLYYDGDQLIGFLGLYGLGSEIEITGMIHPDYRRQGLFTKLLHVAGQQALSQGCSRMLLITEHSSEAGTSFVKHMGSRYAFSEYRMKFAEKAVPDFPQHGITLRKTGQKDFPEILRLHKECFGLPENENGYAPVGYDSIYIAELEGESIGKIGVSIEGQNSYIFGFGIKPGNRGRGYGREVLSRVLLELLSRQITPAILEVAVENEKALSLYRSCGFKEVTVYDYYELKTDPAIA